MKIMRTVSICFAALFVLTASPAESSIVYSGKLNINGPAFNIDLNNDGQDDFITGWRTWAAGNEVSTDGFDAGISSVRYLNIELGGNHSGQGYPGTKAPLDYATRIGAVPPQDLLWAYSSNDAMMWENYDIWNTPSKAYSGVWHDVGQKYIGFELTDNSNIYYGWIQLETDAFNTILLVDFAYEDFANTSVAAGIYTVPLPSALLLLLSGVSILLFRVKCRF